jgi:hypothetical protein
MIHDTNINKLHLLIGQKCLMPKHVFYNLSCTTIMFNTINEMTKNV